MKTTAMTMTACAALLASSLSLSAPITYQGDLTGGGIENGTLESVDWWRFSASAGDVVTITANRRENTLDPYMAFFFGADDTDNLSLLRTGDDEIDAIGPFGDPQIADWSIANDGEYSVAISTFFSGDPGDDGVYDYTIALETSANPNTGDDVGDKPSANVSEPATLGMFALSALGLFGLRRKRT